MGAGAGAGGHAEGVSDEFGAHVAGHRVSDQKVSPVELWGLELRPGNRFELATLRAFQNLHRSHGDSAAINWARKRGCSQAVPGCWHASDAETILKGRRSVRRLPLSFEMPPPAGRNRYAAGSTRRNLAGCASNVAFSTAGPDRDHDPKV